MAEEIDPQVFAEARQSLAEWWNARVADPAQRVTAESFDDWQVGRHEEFLVLTSPGGYTNQLYLVGGGVVKPFSYSTQTIESAAEAARAERDGLVPPEAPPVPPPW